MYSACSLLLFCFEPTVRHLDDLSHCYGKFFRKWHSESYLITAMFKVRTLQLQDTSKTAF